jgi:hypothetical protein
MFSYLKGPSYVAPSVARPILFCTICGKARMCMAVGVDSVGFEESFKELYDDVGIKMSTETTHVLSTA